MVKNTTMNTLTLLLLHRIIVTLFLFLFLFKTILLLIGKKELLSSIRDKTKIVDMILGTLILASGIYLMIVTKNHNMWINMKALFVLIAIPLGIISMKKSNLVLAIIVNLILIGAYGIGEAKPWNKKDNKETTTEVEVENNSSTSETEIKDSVSQSILEQNNVAISTNAKSIYLEKCSFCHGEDGRKGSLGAADLSISTMGTQEKIEIITNGRNAMAGFKAELSKEEIESVAMYLTMLK